MTTISIGSGQDTEQVAIACLKKLFTRSKIKKLLLRLFESPLGMIIHNEGKLR